MSHTMTYPCTLILIKLHIRIQQKYVMLTKKGFNNVLFTIKIRRTKSIKEHFCFGKAKGTQFNFLHPFQINPVYSI